MSVFSEEGLVASRDLYNFLTCLNFIANSYIDFGSSVYNLAYNGKLSVSVWIKPTSNTGTQAIVGKFQRQSPFNGWQISSNAGKIRFDYLATNIANQYQAETQSVVLTPSVWNHVLVVYNNKTLAVYVNKISVPITTITNTLISSYAVQTAHFNIATRNNDETPGSEDFIGRADDVQLYTTNLSESDAVLLFNTGLSSITPNSWWKFDEGSGTTIIDSIGSVNGTLVGSASYVTDKPF